MRAWGPDRVVARRRPAVGATAPDAGRDPARPRRGLVVLCCMDCRVDPAALLGLGIGDAHIIRNAGARATPDVIRSVALSQTALGTRQVLVLGHTDCRALSVPGDPARSVREAVRALCAAEVIPRRTAVRGVVFDVDDGVLLPASVSGDGGRRRVPVRRAGMG